MSRLLAFIFVLFSSTLAYATQVAPLNPQYCQVHAPWGVPSVVKQDSTLICRKGYFTLHDNLAKIPVWTSWTVTPQTVNGCLPRGNDFAADLSLPPGKRATPNDYARSGFDQGHVANDAHQSWDPQAKIDSFLMTNMMPQLPGLNRGIWKLLETATGAWVYSRQQSYIVYAGPIYILGQERVIGNGRVTVPRGFFKILINQATNEHWAFVFPHAENLGNDLRAVQSTVAQVEQLTGIQFPMPANTNKSQVLALSPIDFKGVAQAKRTLCKQ